MIGFERLMSELCYMFESKDGVDSISVYRTENASVVEYERYGYKHKVIFESSNEYQRMVDMYKNDGMKGE